MHYNATKGNHGSSGKKTWYERDWNFRRLILTEILGASAKPGISALVIDDDQTMRNAMASLLRSETGIQDVATAGNGLQGWKALAEKPFDIVLVDWMMPVMDGYNFVKTVRRDANRHKTKIIMIT